MIPVLTLDASGDSAGTGVVGHQHHVTASQADEGRQRCALGAALLFVDLDDDFLAFAYGLLDLHPSWVAGAVLEVFPRDILQWQEAMTVRTELDEGGF